MGLTAGRRLGPYEIVAPLGAGGMGEVYRARDTRLGRDVAIKVLPGRAWWRTPRRASRFEREARAVAALSHPHILAIHDFGVHEGAALRRHRAARGRDPAPRGWPGGPLPLRKALELAGQMAEGLAARAREGDRPPRPEAGERVPDRGRPRQDPRLRPGEGAARTQRRRARRRSRCALDRAGHRARHGRLHVAGAGARRARWTTAPTSSRSAPCSTRCSRPKRPSRPTPPSRR